VIKMQKNKKDKSKILGKILAIILAVMTILGISATCIYAIIQMVAK